MAKTARDRAQKLLDDVEGRIAKLKERRDTAVAKVEGRYKGQLEELTKERDGIAQLPALQPQPGEQPADAPRVVRDSPQA